MILAILVLTASCAEALPRPANEISLLNLTIIHVNDIHAHFEEVNENTTRCREENACFGGIARMVTKKNEILDEDSEALFLNAGDFYQGLMIVLYCFQMLNKVFSFQELFGTRNSNIIQ